MTDIIQLKQAKYKGVSFLFETAPTIGGNRLVKFNFPGSDKQAIERQGKVPRTFNLTIWIPHADNISTPPRSYYEIRDNLLRVLEDGESGVLTHPTFGDVNNVINGQYTLTEQTSELGRAKLIVPFEVDDAPGIPQVSQNLVSQVQRFSDEFNAVLAADIVDNYEASLSFSGNFSDALDNVQGIADSFTEASQLATPLTDQIDSYSKAIRDFSAQVGSLVQSPAALASSISDLFEATNNLYATPEGTLTAMKGLFTFGSDDPEVNQNTAGRVERKRNRDLIRANMRAQALSYAYLNTPQVEFQTTDDLDLAQEDLEDQYTDVRENQLLSNESLEALDRVRTQAQKTLDNEAVNTKSIITITTPAMPLSVLVYSYYGSTELVDTIAELNNIKQNAFVSGDVRILTA